MGYRIGVVGNRDLTGVDTRRLEAELIRLIGQLHSGIINIWESHNAEPDRVFYSQESPRLYMVNSLAEGADQLAANVVANKLIYDFKLSCPIPFPVDEYKKYFDTEEGREQFDQFLANDDFDPVLIEMDCQSSTPELRREGYRAAADMLLENIDILIAIYDSDRDASKGGSKETHHVAQQRKIPVIHINTNNLDEINLHRKLTRFSETCEPVTDSRIDELLRATLLPTSKHSSELIGANNHGTQKKSCIDDVCRFFKEPSINKTGINYHVMKTVHWSYSLAWKGLYKLLKIGESRPPSRVNCSVGDVAAVMPKLNVHLYSSLKEDIDSLAVQYMDSYRGSFILNFLFGAAAVFLAVFSYFAGGSHSWSIAEMIFLMFILITYLANHFGNWKKRAVDYRFIAEYFRHEEMLALLGRGSQLLQPAPEHNAHHDPSTTWMGWYLNAVVRSQGLFRNYPSPVSGSTTKRIKLDHVYVGGIKSIMCKNWLKDQHDYHLILTKRYERWETLANSSMLVLFLLTILGVFAHLIGWHFWHPAGWSENVFVALMVTAFPALLAAIHGITVQGEFERLAKRSEATADYLAGFIKRFNEIDSDNSRYADAIGDHAVEAAQVMLDEVTDWQILYRAHGVELT